MDVNQTGTPDIEGVSGSTPGASGTAGGPDGNVLPTNSGNGTDTTNATEATGGADVVGGNGGGGTDGNAGASGGATANTMLATGGLKCAMAMGALRSCSAPFASSTKPASIPFRRYGSQVTAARLGRARACAFAVAAALAQDRLIGRHHYRPIGEPGLKRAGKFVRSRLETAREGLS